MYKDAGAPLQAMSLRRNFSWTLAGGVVGAIANWATLLLFARLGTAELLGLYVLATSLLRPIVTLAGLQLRGIQATDARHEFDFSDYLKLRVCMLAVVGIVIFGVANGGGFEGVALQIFLATGAVMILNSLLDVFYGLFQKIERLDWIAKGQIGNGILTLLAVSLGFVVFESAGWALGLSAAVSLGVLLGWAVPVAKRILKFRDRGYELTSLVNGDSVSVLFRLFKVAFPMGIVLALGTLNGSLPRLVVGSEVGASGLGQFAAVTSFLTIGTTLFNSLGQSASPRLAKFFATGDKRAFQGLVMRLLAIAVGSGIIAIGAAMIAGEQVIRLMYGQEFATDRVFITMTAIVASVMFVTSVFGYTNTAMRQFKIQVPINIVSIAALAASCFLFIPSYGLSGAAAAMVVSLVVKGSLACAAVVSTAHKSFATSLENTSSATERSGEAT